MLILLIIFIMTAVGLKFFSNYSIIPVLIISAITAIMVLVLLIAPILVVFVIIGISVYLIKNRTTT